MSSICARTCTLNALPFETVRVVEAANGIACLSILQCFCRVCTAVRVLPSVARMVCIVFLTLSRGLNRKRTTMRAAQDLRLYLFTSCRSEDEILNLCWQHVSKIGVKVAQCWYSWQVASRQCQRHRPMAWHGLLAAMHPVLCMPLHV